MERRNPSKSKRPLSRALFCSSSAHSEAEAPRITWPTIMSAQEESSSRNRLVARRERSAPAAVDRKAAAPVPFTSGVRCCPFSPVWSGLVHGDWWMRPLVVGAWMVWMGSSVRCCCCCRCCWWWTEKAGWSEVGRRSNARELLGRLRLFCSLALALAHRWPDSHDDALVFVDPNARQAGSIWPKKPIMWASSESFNTIDWTIAIVCVCSRGMNECWIAGRVPLLVLRWGLRGRDRVSITGKKWNFVPSQRLPFVSPCMDQCFRWGKERAAPSQPASRHDRMSMSMSMRGHAEVHCAGRRWESGSAMISTALPQLGSPPPICDLSVRWYVSLEMESSRCAHQHSVRLEMHTPGRFIALGFRTPTRHGVQEYLTCIPWTRGDLTWPCLVLKKNYKIFQILRHIKSLDVCMEY